MVMPLERQTPLPEAAIVKTARKRGHKALFKLSRREYLYLIGFGVGGIILDVVVHEAAHIGAAMFSGVRLDEIELRFFGINPGVVLHTAVPVSSLPPVHYAGGLVAGAVWLAAYCLLFAKNLYRKRALTWCVGMLSMMLAFDALANGFIEGRFHEAYVLGATGAHPATSAYAVLDVMRYLFAMAGAGLHVGLCGMPVRLAGDRAAESPAAASQ